MKQKLFTCKQQGVSLVGLIFVLAIIGALAVLAMQIVPTVSEYMAVNKAIGKAKTDGGASVQAIRASFDKQADVAYIKVISGKDLDVYNNGSGLEVAFSYDVKVPLFGPASILIEYAGSTDKQAGKKPAKAVGE